MGIFSRLLSSSAFRWLRGSQAAADPIWRYGSGPLATRVVAVGHWVFLAGITAGDTSVGVAEQTRQVLEKIDEYLTLANSDRSRMLSAMIYLSDLSQRPEMIEVWNAWIEDAEPPTLDCIGAQLEGSAVVEIVVTATA